MKAFIKRNPIASYLLLTFVISWGIFIPFLAITGDSMTVENPINFIFSIIIGFAPSVSALILTSVIEGRVKGSTLMAHFKMKNSWKSYLAVLLIMPCYALANVLLSNLFVTPYKVEVIPFVLVLALFWGLFSSFGEEFGWRGFMFPRMLKKRGWFGCALILGVIWAAWHIPMNYLGAKDYGSYMYLSILLSSIQLILDAVIISELYIIFKGSLKITILYHYTLTGSTILASAICQPAQFSAGADTKTNLLGFALKIIIATVIFLTNRKKLSEGAAAESTSLSAAE